MSELQQHRDAWRHTIEGDGGHCPVCARWGRIYGRAINETMARSLIWLVFAPMDNGWVNIPATAPRWLVRSNQLPTLKWWGLVERCPNEKDSKIKHSGLWRPTALGYDFVNTGARVPKKVFTYNDQVEAHSTETVAIYQCFKQQFDYQEVMNTHFPKVVA
jgi:hypothetical protein